MLTLEVGFELTVYYSAVHINIVRTVLVCYVATYWYLFTDSVTLHVMVEGGLVYLCATESDFGKRQPYAFLNEVRRIYVVVVQYYNS